MGLDFKGAAMVAYARQQGMPMASVLTLGRQESVITEAWCQHLKAAYGAPVEGLDYQREPYGEEFFKRLGAQRIDSLDYSDYQSSTLCRDLNDPPPAEPVEGYDLVYDGGTLEHVFHFPNAIANSMALVKVGGHFMASLPANQWLGHGFYQFSPELFFRVFSPENGFETVRIYLAENGNAQGKLYRVLDPAETGARTLIEGGRPLLILVWARKIAEVKPFQRWPQQSDYSARWAEGKESEAPDVQPDQMSAGRKLRRAFGKLVPSSVRYYIAWRKHLKAARRGLIEIDTLQ